MNRRELYKKYFRWLPLLAVVLSVAGCASDEWEEVDKGLSDDAVTLGFTLNLPNDKSSTRGVSAADEKKIESLDILVFKETAPGVEEFEDVINISPSAISASGKFEASVKLLPEKQRFVLIANLHEPINKLSPAGQLKEDVLHALVVKETGKWNAKSTASFRIIPMWGETGLLTVTASRQSAGTVFIHRMLAKINIKIDPSITPATFSLQEVYLYNRNTRGQLAPDAANWNSAANNGKATAPTLPADTDPSDPLTIFSHKAEGWKYDSGDGLTPAGINNAIYLFETKADHTDRLKTFGLVLGGKYKGSAATHYYRLDLIDASQNYCDLLRNHNYEITIKKVNFDGYTGPDEAFKGEVRLSASVDVWNNGGLGDIIDNGRYMLALSQLKYEFTLDSHLTASSDNQLTITTNYVNDTIPTKRGWTATLWGDKAGTIPVPNDIVTNAPWIELSQTSGMDNFPNGDQIHFKILYNKDGYPRTAWVHVTAGRITAKIEVKQKSEFYPPKHKGWAGSNIYYDGEKLTFDDTSPNAPNNDYGGVFFRWGSLWGLSPVANWSDTSTMYPPGGGSATAAYLGYETWTSIPHVGVGPIVSYPIFPKTQRDRNYLYELNGTEPGIGDICRHITEMNGGRFHGKKWRMPTSTEVGETTLDYEWGPLNHLPDPGEANAAGTGRIKWGQYKREPSKPYFALSGRLVTEEGQQDALYELGFYWTGSPYYDPSTSSVESAFHLILHKGIAFPKSVTERSEGGAVRCVVEAED